MSCADVSAAVPGSSSSLRAVTEVAVHFESFRNIDLFHQGLYHLKCRVTWEGSEGSQPAGRPHGHVAPTPATSEGNPSLNSKPARTDHHNLIPAYIVEDTCTFCTRSFLIRYCEEEVELNDIGQFRLEFEQEALETCAPILLEVELMFSDLTAHGGADRFGEHPDVDSTEFKSVSTASFRLHGLHRGLHEYCPVTFDEYHFCVANVMVHSVLLDYRLRLQPTPTPRRETGKQQTGKSADGSGQGEEPQRRSSFSALMPSAVAVCGGPPQTLSLTESLFGNGLDFSPDQLLRQAEDAHRTYYAALVKSHTGLARWFEQLCTECLGPEQREVFLDDLDLEELPPPTLAAKAAFGASTKLNMRTVSEQLASELNQVACRILELWHRVFAVLLHSPREVGLSLRGPWEQQVARRWNTSVIREAIRPDVGVNDKEDSCGSHPGLAETLRKRAIRSGVDGEDILPVEDLSMIPGIDSRPMIFEERYSGGGAASSRTSGKNKGKPPPAQPEPPPEADDTEPSKPKRYRGVHLFVLVHGFQGNSFDMRLMKNNIALQFPDAVFLSSSCNEDNTEGDITEMGIRLAQEVVNYICDWCPGTALGRLSFISHSLGGLITRAALPLLHEYSSKMFTFMSFSSAHLGIFQDKISLFNTGFWVFKKWRQSTFLQQVSMTDADDPRETFLYKLSKAKGFEYFQHVVLVSCYEDQYGPVQSARAEICAEWDTSAEKEVYREMVRNIWNSVQPDRVRRFDVNFVIAEKNLDAFIGRTAHIQFLECQALMKMLVHCYSALFR